MSYATLYRTLDTGGLWSIARGLARRQRNISNISLRVTKYDGALYGRGHLGDAALSNFTRFFLEICIDQVKFMAELMQPGSLRDRIMKWAEEASAYGTLPARASRVLDAILFRGSLP